MYVAKLSWNLFSGSCRLSTNWKVGGSNPKRRGAHEQDTYPQQLPTSWMADTAVGV